MDLTSGWPFSAKLKNGGFVVQINGSGNLQERHHKNTRMFLFGAGVYSRCDNINTQCRSSGDVQMLPTRMLPFVRVSE